MEAISKKLESKDSIPENRGKEVVPQPIINASKRGALRAQKVPHMVPPIQRQESAGTSQLGTAMMHKDSGS